MIYSFIVFGLVETIEDLPAHPYSYSPWESWGILDTLSQLHLPRNLHVDFYSRHKSALVSNPSKFEQVSELVRKVFTSARCYLHWYLLKAESALMARFWRVFTLLFSWWRSNTWVFGSKWWKHADLQKLGLALILLCSMLVGLWEDWLVLGC
jgi:hypothetical protein